MLHYYITEMSLECAVKPQQTVFIVPRAIAKAGDIKTHSSVCLSVPLSVRLSVTKTLTWLISSALLKIEH